MGHYLVRYSLLGQIGRFRSADGTSYPRRARVVIRSHRGLELGEVVAQPDATTAMREMEGQILRRVTVEDNLLAARLDKHRHQAFNACASLLQENDVPANLIDVEHLLDGQGLFFYFLGEIPAEAEAYTEQLAATYETTVEFRKFAQTLAEGCGPDCGTAAAAGNEKRGTGG